MTDLVRREPPAVNGRRGGLWRQRNFALFWTGESISEVGNSVTVIVVPLVAIDTLHWCAPVSLEAAMPANPMLP